MMLFPQGGFVGTLRIVPDSAPFSVGADGTVRVKNSTVLDRETTERFTFQVIHIWRNLPLAPNYRVPIKDLLIC